MEKRMTVEKAAELLGMRTQTLRLAIRKGKFKQFAEAWENDERFTYYINPYQLYKYIGKEVPGEQN